MPTESLRKVTFGVPMVEGPTPPEGGEPPPSGGEPPPPEGGELPRPEGGELPRPEQREPPTPEQREPPPREQKEPPPPKEGEPPTSDETPLDSLRKVTFLPGEGEPPSSVEGEPSSPEEGARPRFKELKRRLMDRGYLEKAPPSFLEGTSPSLEEVEANTPEEEESHTPEEEEPPSPEETEPTTPEEEEPPPTKEEPIKEKKGGEQEIEIDEKYELTPEKIEEIEREVALFKLETGFAYDARLTPSPVHNQSTILKGGKKGKDKKEKRKKTKKLSKKEKARLATRQTEELRKAADDERRSWQVEEVARQERELIFLEERAINDRMEQNIRDMQLESTADVLREHWQKVYRFDLELREKEKWEQYIKCDGLPDPASVAELNCYLFAWRLELEGCTIERVVARNPDVIEVLKAMTHLIDYPLDNPPSRVDEWKDLRKAIRREQQLHMDEATYQLLRKMKETFELTELNTMRFDTRASHFIFYMWGLWPLPIPSEDSRYRDLGHTSECEFPELGIYIHMPQALADKYLAIRAIWLQYDHLSDLCPSFETQPIPSEFLTDLYTASINEGTHKITLRAEYEEKVKKRSQRRMARLLPFDAPGRPGWTVPDIDLTRQLNKPLTQYLPPLIPYALYRHIPTPAEVICSEQDAEELELKNNLTYNAALHELNLRRYVILGGVFHLNLLSLPPKPREMFRKFVLTTLDAPPRLTQEPFHEIYPPLPPTEEEVSELPEEVEVEPELKEPELQEPEDALEKLCLVTLTLPSNVLWFEPPIVVGWDPEKEYWSTEDCHDLKFSEEEQTVQFRAGRLGPFGLAVDRYVNLPYRGWVMKPDRRTGGVSISISAAIALVKFVVLEDLVCLSVLQNGGSAALQELIGVFMRPEKLVNLLIEGGLNIFPSHDAFCYVEGVTSKHRACEDHLYQCIALCGTAYNFAWSHWNLLAGYRGMVLQMRAYINHRNLPPYSMLHVTTHRTLIVDCTEAAQTFSEEEAVDMEFYADLYHLVQEHSGEMTKQKINEQSFKTTDTVYKMLTRIKPLSFS